MKIKISSRAQKIEEQKGRTNHHVLVGHPLGVFRPFPVPNRANLLPDGARREALVRPEDLSSAPLPPDLSHKARSNLKDPAGHLRAGQSEDANERGDELGLERVKHLLRENGSEHLGSSHLETQTKEVSLSSPKDRRRERRRTGAITLTQMPYFAPSLASVFVNPMRPILAAE